MKKILHVDDSETIVMMSKMILKDKFELTIARDGEDGLNKFRQEKFDLIISDVNMPKMTGLEMIKEIRKIDTEIPILVLTTETEQCVRKAGQEAGANGWIVKPFKPSSFIDTLEQAMQ